MAVVLATGGMLVLVVLAGGPSPSPYAPSAPRSRPRTGAPVDLSHSFMFGAYGNPIVQRSSTGHGSVDINATVLALSQASITSYAYLIAPDSRGDPRVSEGQLRQLPAFAAAAATRGINVYVYLVPPTEASENSYAPYFWDYVQWFTKIGQIAASYPAIKGVIVDDFGGNTSSRSKLAMRFSPTYVRRMVDAGRMEAPWLLFLPVLYYQDIIGKSAIVTRFMPVIDGVIFPYLGSTNTSVVPGNTTDATRAYEQGSVVSDRLRCWGQTNCRELVFPGNQTTTPRTDVATLSGDGAVRPNTPRRLSLWLYADPSTGGGSVRVIARVNGNATVGHTVQPGWHQYSFQLSAATSRREQARVSVALSRATRPGAAGERVMVGVTSVGGLEPHKDLSSFHFTTTSGVATSSWKSLPVVFMTYTAPLGVEAGKGAEPKYVADVLRDVGRLRSQGKVQGSMVYLLNLSRSGLVTGDQGNYAVVKSVYQAWLHGR